MRLYYLAIPAKKANLKRLNLLWSDEMLKMSRYQAEIVINQNWLFLCEHPLKVDTLQCLNRLAVSFPDRHPGRNQTLQKAGHLDSTV